MYVPFQDATFIPATFDAGTFTREGTALPRIDAIAAKDRAGKLWLAITNLDPNQSAEIELALPGVNVKSAAGETLSAPKVDSVNTFDAPNRVAPKAISAKAQHGQVTLQLEPKSITVVAVEQ
jgi:alpha-N-arabinofuranosidase